MARWVFYTQRVPPERWVYAEYAAAIEEERKVGPTRLYTPEEFEDARQRRIAGIPDPKPDTSGAVDILLALRCDMTPPGKLN